MRSLLVKVKEIKEFGLKKKRRFFCLLKKKKKIGWVEESFLVEGRESNSYSVWLARIPIHYMSIFKLPNYVAGILLL